jgi:hypothetical protein
MGRKVRSRAKRSAAVEAGISFTNLPVTDFERLELLWKLPKCVATVIDVASNLRAQDRMKQIAARPGLIIPGHDPAVMAKVRIRLPGSLRSSKAPDQNPRSKAPSKTQNKSSADANHKTVGECRALKPTLFAEVECRRTLLGIAGESSAAARKCHACSVLPSLA